MFKGFLPVILALSAMPAWGLTTFYVGPTMGDTGYSAALGSIVMGGPFNFSGESCCAGATNVGGTGVDFMAQQGYIDIVSNQATYYSGTAGNSFRINFPANIYALTLTLSRVHSSVPGNWNYGIIGQGNSGSLTIPSSGTYFLGVISDTPLSSIFLSGGADGAHVVVQNFSVGTMSQTPEPSTMALMGGALISLTLMARRRRRS